ncbi:MAG TPA: hypothetical protein VFE98_02470 [Candidatus Bathyarchaeia archaeon]|nr:hypothetical protein [Candidatus Bathyarchaeia archaeon]
MKKIMKNKKGIDTILAALLMVVIVVVASVMVYAWSTGLLGTLLVTPSTGKESLQQETVFFPGTTYMNMTVNIRNTGSVAATLVSYYVKDSSGNQYAKTSGWTNAPTVPPNAVATGVFLINTQCTGCSLTGTAFTFQSGYSYTVVVVTSRNNQFTFTGTK